jgi:hypothetical protein
MSNIIAISDRLRDGREVKTAADFRQWIYEHLDGFSKEVGVDWAPIDVFPAMTRVMVEWCDNTLDAGSENAQALCSAIGELTGALGRCLALLENQE